VAIRRASGDGQGGALKIGAQQPIPAVTRIGAKALVLAVAWLVASLPGAIAIGLWRSYGGSIYPPEVATVLFGHLLNAGLTIALAAVTAAGGEHPSTAAGLPLSGTPRPPVLYLLPPRPGGVWGRLARHHPPPLIAPLP